MIVTSVPIAIGAFDTVTIGLIKGPGELEISWTVETIQSTALLKISKNTEKNPGYLERLADTQT